MEPQPVRVLLVEDNPDDAQLVRRTLERDPAAPGGFRLDHVGVLQQAIDRLGKQAFDVILLDLHLPDSQGVETVERLREVEPHAPIVVFTSVGDEATSLGALHAGAQDYLVKDELAGSSMLQRGIRYAMERVRLEREKQALHERLYRVERLQSLGALAAGTAVRFEALLDEIVAQSERALDAGRPTRETLYSIQRTAVRAGQMAAQLRDYSLDVGGEVSPVDLSQLVMDASPLLDSSVGRGVTIDYSLSGSLPRIFGNPIDLRRLIVYLVNNASEAIEGPGGVVSIRTSTRAVDAEFLAETEGATALQPGRYVVVRVGDTGRGLEATGRERLFDPFYTTKSAGRGLGLSAAFGIVRRHGGAIHVGDGEEGGAEFLVLFPVSS